MRHMHGRVIMDWHADVALGTWVEVPIRAIGNFYSPYLALDMGIVHIRGGSADALVPPHVASGVVNDLLSYVRHLLHGDISLGRKYFGRARAPVRRPHSIVGVG